MQIRDWIIIIVPIICNGIIIFLVQKHYAQRLERKLRQDVRLINTITDFKKEIHKGTVILSEFNDPLSAEATNDAVKRMRDFFIKDFCIFYDNNRIALSYNEEAIERLISQFNIFLSSRYQEDDSATVHLNAVKSNFIALSDELEQRLQQL